MSQPGSAKTGWLAWLRLRHWAHFLLLPLAGVDPAANYELMFGAVLRGVALAFTLLGFGYLLNGLSDRAVDRDPNKSLPQAGWRPWLLLGALWLLALGLAATAPLVVQVASAVCLLSGILYSVGPRWKSVPLLGSALNLTNFAPLLVVGAAPGRPMPLLAPLLALFAPLLLQNQLVHEAADAPDDRAAGISTTFVRYGVAKTALLAGLCGLLAAAVLAGVLRDPLRWPLAAVWLALFGLWIPLQLWRHGAQPAQMARLRLQQRWLALAAGGGACLAVVVFE